MAFICAGSCDVKEIGIYKSVNKNEFQCFNAFVPKSFVLQNNEGRITVYNNSLLTK